MKKYKYTFEAMYRCDTHMYEENFEIIGSLQAYDLWEMAIRKALQEQEHHCCTLTGLKIKYTEEI